MVYRFTRVIIIALSMAKPLETLHQWKATQVKVTIWCRCRYRKYSQRDGDTAGQELLKVLQITKM